MMAYSWWMGFFAGMGLTALLFGALLLAVRRRGVRRRLPEPPTLRIVRGADLEGRRRG